MPSNRPLKRVAPGVKTSKEMEALHRNNRIRMLRGIYANITGYVKDPARRKMMLDSVDMELAELGAQPESIRRAEGRNPHGYYEGFGKKRKFMPYIMPTPNTNGMQTLEEDS